MDERGWADARGSVGGRNERRLAGLADVVGLAESAELSSASVTVAVVESSLGWACAGVARHDEG